MDTVRREVMKFTSKRKEFISRVLAATMAVAMAAPPATSYAVINPDDTVVVTFQTPSGTPGLEYNPYFKQAFQTGAISGYTVAKPYDSAGTLSAAPTHSTAPGVYKNNSTGATYYVIQGKAGTPYMNIAPLGSISGLPTSQYTAGDGDNEYQPIVPQMNNMKDPSTGESVSWEGYKFDGWYLGGVSGGTKKTLMDYTYQYTSTPSLYEAKWIPDPDKTYSYTLQHYYYMKVDSNGIPVISSDNESQLPALWPDDYDNWPADIKSQYKIFKLHDDEVTSGVTADSKVNATYVRGIPGFDAVSYGSGKILIDGNRAKDFKGQYINSEANAEAYIGSNRNLSGTMPNSNIKVLYQYQPSGTAYTAKVTHGYYETTDDGQTVFVTLGTSIEAKGVGEQVSIEPGNYRGYIPRTLEITKGYRSQETSSSVADGTLYLDDYIDKGINAVIDGTTSYTSSGTTYDAPTKKVVMPNQNIELRYVYEKDPNARDEIAISCYSENGDAMGSWVIQAPIGEYIKVWIPNHTQNGYLAPTTHFTNVTYGDNGVCYSVDATSKAEALAKIDEFIADGYMTAADKTRLEGQLDDLATELAAEGISMSYKGSICTLMLKNTSGIGQVSLEYAIDESNPDLWARVKYTLPPSPAYGGLAGNTTNWSNGQGLLLNKDQTYTLDELLGGLLEKPDSGYKLDGWYRVDASGNPVSKLSDSVTLSDDILTPVSGEPSVLTICPKYVKDDSQWITIHLTAGTNTATVGNEGDYQILPMTWSQFEALGHTDLGTRGIDLEEVYDAIGRSYVMAGWYDENDNPMDDNAMLLASQTIKLKFVSNNADDVYYAIPDVDTKINVSNGSGEIKVNNPHQERKYIVTDSAGNVVDVKWGMDLSTHSFTGLEPSGDYRIYEASATFPVTVGANISGVSGDAANDISAYQRVTIPALGSNYRITDRDHDSKKEIIISPAASGMVYAIIDEDGNEVIDRLTGQPFGWKEPVDGVVEFTNIDTDHNYSIVAKPASDTTTDPADLIDFSSDIFVPGDGSTSAEDRTYTLTILGGGYVTDYSEHTNADVVTNEPLKYVVTGLSAGKEVAITTAPETTTTTTTTTTTVVNFKKWDVLIGDVTLPSTTYRSNNFDMPAGDVVLRSVYDDDELSLASPADASIDYSPKGGNFALNFDSQEKLIHLKEALASNDGDQNALNQGYKLEYVIKFDDRAPLASVSEAVKKYYEENEGEGAGDSIQIPRQVEISVTRKVDGINRNLTSTDFTKPFDIYGVLAPSYLGNSDYHVYRIVYAADGEPTLEHVETDELDDPDRITGVFTIPDVYIGDTLVLVFQKSMDVKIVDTKDLTSDLNVTMRLKSGQTINEALEGDYWQLGLELAENPDIVGLSTSTSPSDVLSVDYLETHKVRKNMSLYILYSDGPDQDWIDANENLKKLIEDALGLAGNEEIREDLRNELREAALEANDLRNAIPLPTTQELIDAYNDLLAKYEQASLNGIGDDDNTDTNTDDVDGDEDDDNVTNSDDEAADKKKTHIPGGSSSSGGGKGSGGNSKYPNGTVNTYVTYTEGTEGTWVFNPASQSWNFQLSTGDIFAGNWANVRYYINDVPQVYTYYFDTAGNLLSGWQQIGGQWYYLSEVHDGFFGHRVTGWYQDPLTGHWYYMDPVGGSMDSGWQQVDS
jgi:glucan-binding YG repeat protein